MRYIYILYTSGGKFATYAYMPSTGKKKVKSNLVSMIKIEIADPSYRKMLINRGNEIRRMKNKRRICRLLGVAYSSSIFDYADTFDCLEKEKIHLISALYKAKEWGEKQEKINPLKG